MGLAIVYGATARDRTADCLADLLDALGTGRVRSAFLVVPEEAKLEAERRLLAETPSGCLMQVEVSSFFRLSHRLAGEACGRARPRLDAASRAFLLHRILRRRRETFRTFGRMADHPGFVPQVEAVLGDFRRHGIDGALLRRVADGSAEGSDAETAADDVSGFRLRAGDFAQVLSDYEEALRSQGLADPESALPELAALLERAGPGCPWPLSRLAWLAEAGVWVDGFGATRDFTPQELAVLQALSARTRQVTVFVDADAWPASPAAVDAGPLSHLPGRRTLWSLAGGHPTGETRPVVRRLPYSDQASGQPVPWSLARLSRPAPDLGAEPEPAPTDAIRLVESSDPWQECAWIAGEIRRLVQVEGFRMQEIAVTLPQAQGYGIAMERAFRSAGLAMALDRPRPLAGAPLFRFLLALVDLAAGSCRPDTVMELLRTGYTGLSPDECDRFENVVLALGLDRKDRILDDARYRTGWLPAGDRPGEEPETGEGELSSREQEEAERRQEARRIRDLGLLPLFGAAARLSAARTQGDRAGVLLSEMDRLSIRSILSDQSRRLVEKDEQEGALVAILSWNAAVDILDRMRLLLADETGDLRLFRDLLAAASMAVRAGVLPSSPDRVLVGPVERMVHRAVRVLFVPGCLDGTFPAGRGREGLWKDRDRERLEHRTGIRLPSVRRDKAAEDAALVHQLFSVPTERLVLSWPRVGGDGKPGFPSSAFRDLQRRFPGAIRGSADPPLPASADDLALDGRLLSPLSALPLALRHAVSACRACPGSAGPGSSAGPADPGCAPMPSPAARVLLHALVPLPGTGWSGLRDECLAVPSPRVRISSCLVGAFYPDEPEMSVSQLETYGRCPFSHFASYLLKLEERPEWRPEVAEAGTLAHALVECGMRELESALARVTSSGEDPRGLLAAWCSQDFLALAERLLSHAAAREGIPVMLDGAYRISGGRKVVRMAGVSLQAASRQLLQEAFLPHALEWPFGRSSGNPLRIPLPDGRAVSFRGRIDRVDRSSPDPDGRSWFRVIDYKSGDRTFDRVEHQAGLQLQLPLYLAAFGGVGFPDRARSPREAAYFHLDCPTHSLADLDGALDGAALLKADARAFALRSMKAGTLEDMTALVSHSVNQAAAACVRLLGGRFDVEPTYRNRQGKPCRYCPYQGVCGILAGRFPGRVLKPSPPAVAGSSGEATP